MDERVSSPIARIPHPSFRANLGRREIAYAEGITAAFREGHLTDCDEGVSLRQYMAEALRCAPMRVSKKFANCGSIGKLMFIRRASSEERVTAMTHLEELANAFWLVETGEVPTKPHHEVKEEAPTKRRRASPSTAPCWPRPWCRA